MLTNRTPLLNRHDVELITGLSRSTVYRLMRRGIFPEPIRVGLRAVRWHQSEIDNYLAQQPRAKGNG